MVVTSQILRHKFARMKRRSGGERAANAGSFYLVRPTGKWCCLARPWVVDGQPRRLEIDQLAGKVETLAVSASRLTFLGKANPTDDARYKITGYCRPDGCQ